MLSWRRGRSAAPSRACSHRSCVLPGQHLGYDVGVTRAYEFGGARIGHRIRRHSHELRCALLAHANSQNQQAEHECALGAKLRSTAWAIAAEAAPRVMAIALQFDDLDLRRLHRSPSLAAMRLVIRPSISDETQPTQRS